MSDGYPRVGGRADRAGDSGHHFERHSRRGQRFRFLATATEHERIATLEPDHHAAGAAPLDEHPVDLVLRQLHVPRCLTCRHQFRRGGRQREQRG